jgi:hypothetical protein
VEEERAKKKEEECARMTIERLNTEEERHEMMV